MLIHPFLGLARASKITLYNKEVRFFKLYHLCSHVLQNGKVNGNVEADDTQMLLCYNPIVPQWALRNGLNAEYCPKERLHMKYCPYCGANLPDGAVSFCPECGENLPNMTEEREKKHEQPATSPDTATENRKAAPKKVKQKRKQKEPQEQDTESSSKPDDGYDGYYDDVLPADAGRLNEGIDMELVKKICAVTGVMLLIITLCVVAMYLL